MIPCPCMLRPTGSLKDLFLPLLPPEQPWTPPLQGRSLVLTGAPADEVAEAFLEPATPAAAGGVASDLLCALLEHRELS